MNLQIYIIILVLQIILSINHFKMCKNINLLKIMIYILHHLLDVYVFFGFLINETKKEFITHLLLIIGLLIHWFTNNYDCILTTYLNNLCGFNKKEWFQSIMFRIYKFTNIYYIHSYWLFGLILYDLYKILN
jgi:hypothetical protein